MSFLLAIECASKPLSVALFDEQKLLEEIFCPPDDKTHSEKLLPLIHQLLERHQVTPKTSFNIAVTAGPGSFTCIRVGMATAMGLAMGLGNGVYAVSSLKALARGVDEDKVSVAAVMKGGRGKIYGAVYEKNVGAALLPEAIYDPQDFAVRLQKIKKPFLIVGNGFELIEELLTPELKTFYRKEVEPRARWVGKIVFEKHPPLLNPDQIRMRYLQEPDLG